MDPTTAHLDDLFRKLDLFSVTLSSTVNRWLPWNTVQILCAATLVSSCIDWHSIVPPELVGMWRLTDQSAVKFPVECRKMRIEFTSDGRFITVSGQFELVAKVTVIRKTGGFLVRQKITEHNDKPNCQGKSPHFIISNFVHEIYFEKYNGVLRQYIWTKKSGRFVEFVRVSD